MSSRLSEKSNLENNHKLIKNELKQIIPDRFLKKTHRAGGVAQVEHLPSKHKIQSSNSGTTKKEKEKEKKKGQPEIGGSKK
jgi:hypothetical protein